MFRKGGTLVKTLRMKAKRTFETSVATSRHGETSQKVTKLRHYRYENLKSCRAHVVTDMRRVLRESFSETPAVFSELSCHNPTTC